MKFPNLFIVVLSLFFIYGSIYSQVTKQWSSIYNGSANDTDEVTTMFVDNQGNVYVSGYSKGSSTGKDIATVKYNSSGVQIWAARFNNDQVNGDEIASAVAVDGSGNVIVTGYSAGSASFKDYITLKYSSSGSVLWSARYNGTGNDDDDAAAVSIDAFGNIIVTGYSVGLNTSEDYLTIKYNSAGTQLWVSAYNNSEMDDIDIASSIGLDDSGNIYVTGYSIGSGTAEDYATVKYNSSGAEQWVRRYNGTGNGYDITASLAVDASNNICVTGFSFGNGSDEDYATLKYDSQGDLIWTNRFNGTSNQYDISTSVSADASGNVYVTGYSYNDVSSEDYATIKYTAAGNQEWVAIYNGQSNDFDIASSVKTDNSGGVYVTGYSFNSVEEENYATIKYNSSGIRQWEEIYNGQKNGSDIASALTTDLNGNVFVSGYSYDGANSVDYVTLKYSQSVGINQISGIIPDGFNLSQNFPNPFNPSTRIRFEIAGAVNDGESYVVLTVHDIQGKEISKYTANNLQPGSYEYNFDGSNFSAGVYFYNLRSGKYSQTKKMLLIK